MRDWFRVFAKSASHVLGSAWAFTAAVLLVTAWVAAGSLFQYSDAWQLAANTITNTVTFIMVFILQNSQNRDSAATQLKLDELLRALKGARTGLVNLESLSDEDLMQLQREFERLQRQARGQPASQRGQSGPPRGQPASRSGGST